MAKSDKNQPLKKVANVWTRLSNPLRTLNNYQIEQMLQQARFGNDARLQLCYYECEKSSPIFSACINKRIAGVQERNWDIIPMDESSEAKAQAEQVKAMFEKADLRVEDNLTNAIRHLTLASFRGRAAVKPFIDENGDLLFKKLENWNYLRYNGKNYWNPEASQTSLVEGANADIVDLPNEEICYVYDDKPCDWIGVTIYLRQLVGEDAWARFIEKEGIPQVIITAPEGTPETDLEKWNYRAQAIYEGGSGCLPFSSEVAFPTAQTRAQDPFTAFISHQNEIFCIMSTGGALDTLAGTNGATGTGMGSDVATKQSEQFQSLVSYDCKRISNAMNVAVDKCVASLFGDGAVVKCRFSYVEKDNTTPKEYLELAQMAHNMGITVDVAALKELTGLTFLSGVEKDVWTPDISKRDEQK